MSTLTEEIWSKHLSQARWYQGKGLELHRLTITALPWYIQSHNQWVRSELAIADHGDRQDTYHLLVGYTPRGLGEPDAVVGQCFLEGLGEVDILDAPSSPSAMRAFLEAAQRGDAGITWYEAEPDPSSPTQVHSGEQTNTTVNIGDSLLLKMFRKLDPHPHQEARTLLDLSSSGITPRLTGTWACDSFDLGLFCEKIPDALDGWSYAVDAARSSHGISNHMHSLGLALRTLHRELARIYGTGTTDSCEIHRQMVERLKEASASFPELSQLNIPRTLSSPCELMTTQRIHGDFHLAQALISPRGWTIIDFEGEPLKSPQERMSPDSVWRDVAGLLRSLDYARYSHPDPEGSQARQWYEDGRKAFLNGYLGDSLEPSPLLTAYEVDKAIYEYTYEARNRPSWAEIPLQALTRASSAPHE